MPQVSPMSAGDVTRSSPIPLYLQIEQELRDLIEAGTLRALDRVPSEPELAEQFQVSRMTARKALDRLVGDGLLFRRSGKGTFVAPPKITHGFSQQLSFSAAMRALTMRHSTQVLASGMAEAPHKVAIALQVPVGSPVVFMRRLRLVEGDPAAIHMSYLLARFASLLEADLRGSLTELMVGVGARVTQARDAVEVVLATGEDAHLLGVPPGAPLVRIEGTAFSDGHEALRFSEALYRGDRFQFIVESAPADFRLEMKDGRAREP